jgi:hypothetical protein
MVVSDRRRRAERDRPTGSAAAIQRTSRVKPPAGGFVSDARVGVDDRHILQEQAGSWSITIRVTRHGRRGR